MWNSAPSAVSGTHWGSWNAPSADEGALPYSLTSEKFLVFVNLFIFYIRTPVPLEHFSHLVAHSRYSKRLVERINLYTNGKKPPQHSVDSSAFFIADRVSFGKLCFLINLSILSKFSKLLV